jgi:hypothetical protein
MFDIADLCVRGPALVTFGGQTFWSQGDIVARPQLELWPVRSSLGGDLSRRVRSLVWEIGFTPVGEITAAQLAVTHPYGTPTVGASFRTATDRDLVIHGADGVKITFYAAGVWKQPDLKLSPDETAMGEITFRALGKNDTAWTAADKFYKIESAAFSGAGPSLANTITQGWKAVWGVTEIRAEGPIMLRFGVGWKERMVNGDAIVDYSLKGDGLECAASFVPADMAFADYLALLKMQGAGAIEPGGDLAVATPAADLSIVGLTSAWTFTVKNAVPTAMSGHWGEDPLRTGEIAFAATRVAYNGALFTLAAPA